MVKPYCPLKAQINSKNIKCLKFINHVPIFMHLSSATYLGTWLHVIHRCDLEVQ
jgi:hypothetical protein